MNIKAMTVEVEGKNVAISREKGGVAVTIHHMHQRNVPVLYQIDGEEGDMLEAQRIVECVTGVSWKKSHTVSMVADLVTVLRQVAGV